MAFQPISASLKGEMMRHRSLERRAILRGIAAAVGLVAVGRVPGGLRVVQAAEAAGEKDYIGFFGRFGRTPFVVIEKPKGTAVRVKAAFGLRQLVLDAQQAKSLLTGMDAKHMQGVPGVVVYSTGKGKPVEIVYPGGAEPYVSIADPSEAEGSGGGGSGR
jgi:hypothetical protein